MGLNLANTIVSEDFVSIVSEDIVYIGVFVLVTGRSHLYQAGGGHVPSLVCREFTRDL